MRLPPRSVRRMVLAPAVVALAVVTVTTLPLWLLVAAAASPLVPGWLRPLRLLWISVFYLALNAVALAVMFVLWLASGFGWKKRSPPFERAHYLLTGWCLAVLFWQIRWTLRLRIRVSGPDPDVAAPGRPELVLCRHAGPGDSFILIHALLNWYRRDPRIVLQDTLQWDPAVDVLLNVWRELPMDKQITMRFWSVPPDQVPAGRVARQQWLYDWWRTIDDWVEANRPASQRPG